MTALSAAFAAIDAANARDPDKVDGQPASLLYGQRMTAEQIRLFPDAREALQIAARGQHIERWVLRRADYPEGREGYLTWRRDLAGHHAERVAAIMAEAGYDQPEIDAARRMLLKQGIKRDPDVQALEDVICFVFLKWYFQPFSTTQSPEKLQRIVQKTARKMSAEARALALDTFDMPPPFTDLFTDGNPAK
ncbi:DUF4202 domain-containing protein [Litoreibacter arenae]|uniref:Glutamyl-tRNA synthetase n=1 Tax=Litoreibacter arenae DSM 19593 TaxID=1123360 RepID=S9QFA5_9RHOB|nr:DUF4202 domain-containing protein [Litoreibacter arenae]EPX78567.1 hypothetical protein thalar_02359 [Litoreibacter arenae DSM 19593]